MAYQQHPHAPAILSVISNLIQADTHLSRMTEFWHLASAELRKNHGIEVAASRVEKHYKAMKVADSSLPDARSFIRKGVRKTARWNNARKGEGKEGEKPSEFELPFRGR